MEQLIIFLLLIVASIISSIVQNRKKREEMQRDLEGRPPEPESEPQAPRWPSRAEWQERLKRMIEEAAPPPPPPVARAPEPRQPAAPPPIIPTLVEAPAVRQMKENVADFKKNLKESTAVYREAAHAHEDEHARRRRIEEARKKAAPRHLDQRSSAIRARRWLQNPATVREAFVASIIFAPPPAFQEPSQRHF